MLLVRSYREEDLSEILKLHSDTIAAINSRDYTPEQIAVWNYKDELTYQLWQNILAASYTMVAESDGQIVGFANMFLEQGYIDRFYVHKNYQRKGVGQALLVALEARAKEEKLAKLTVESSITAKDFFEHNGFKLVLQQQKELSGVTLTNYVMEKVLITEN
ncbi:MAG: GNAT family N-acetyltransferase [Spirochaetaceae bacterium]|nr:GNAT family N-acetyltransferase [Spirochaetaceae bacterium]